MSLSKQRLLQIVREETLAEIGMPDALKSLGKAAVSSGEKLYRKAQKAMGVPPTHTGGRVTRGGSQGKRAQDASVVGVDASETPAEAEAALAAETPYGPEHSIYTATRGARGGGRVTAGGSGGERAKAAERLGVDPSQDPVDVDPWAFPGAPGEERSSGGRAGKPRRGHRGRGEPDKYGDQTIGQSEYFSGAYPKESLTRSRLRRMVMEEIASSRVNEAEKWIQGAEEDIEKRGTEGACTGKKFGGPTCRSGTKRYNLAKTFRKMGKKRKKKSKKKK